MKVILYVLTNINASISLVFITSLSNKNALAKKFKIAEVKKILRKKLVCKFLVCARKKSKQASLAELSINKRAVTTRSTKVMHYIC